MIRLVESTSEQIKWMTEIAHQDTKYNTGKYNSAAWKQIIEEDGIPVGYLELVPCFFISGLYIDQTLDKKDKCRIMNETCDCLHRTGQKYVWTVKRYIYESRKIKHLFANYIYHRLGKKFNLRKLDIWYKF